MLALWNFFPSQFKIFKFSLCSICPVKETFWTGKYMVFYSFQNLQRKMDFSWVMSFYNKQGIWWAVTMWLEYKIKCIVFRGLKPHSVNGAPKREAALSSLPFVCVCLSEKPPPETGHLTTCSLQPQVHSTKICF